MHNPWKGKSLLSLADFSPEEIRYLLDLSHTVKKESRAAGRMPRRFEGKTIALIFEKRSTRTRCAFETAFGEEGGHPVFLSTQDIQLGAKESVEDTARVLGRMFDAIQFRGFKQETAEALAKYSGVPVYNGLTDTDHPTQVLADLMTIEEEFGKLCGTKLVFVGDGRNNVARALMTGCSKMGVSYSIISPKSLFPDEGLLERCRGFAESSGAKITVTDEIGAELSGAEAVYTDVWVSMGEEAGAAERMKLLASYQVNAALMAKTGRADTVFLHCLPAVKGNEVTPDVIDGPASRAWEEAENRKHTIKALMIATL
ncbi:MAG: ornithine carbamoyltransferase [Spirochaetales bacterium]|jgi:ornithine carbamoyltransferase|nr:ornithine carbamoyltransferase [Spirochaetales bacterium]